MISSHVLRELFRSESVIAVPELGELREELRDLRISLAELIDQDLSQSCYSQSGRLYWYLKCSLLLDLLVVAWVLSIWFHRSRQVPVIIHSLAEQPEIAPGLTQDESNTSSTSDKLRETLAEIEELKTTSLILPTVCSEGALTKPKGGGPVRPSTLGKGARARGVA